MEIKTIDELGNDVTDLTIRVHGEDELRSLMDAVSLFSQFQEGQMVTFDRCPICTEPVDEDRIR